MGRRATRVSGVVAALAVATGVVYALRPVAPTLSLGVVYTPAVIGVAALWGVAWAVAAAALSMLAFNLLFLPPVGTLTLADGRNWTALAVYVACGIVAAELAGRARRRAEEAERRGRETAFLADVAAELLHGEGTPDVRDLARRADVVVGAPPGPHLEAALDALVETARSRERLEAVVRESEALRRSDAIKTTILRSVSHDFRTPLATMQAAVDGLAAAPADDELVRSLRTELARLTRLVTNLLDLSRIQAAAVAPRPELWPVDELVAQALETVDDERVAVALPEGLPPVAVDAAQIGRALGNLLDNALKFSAGDVDLAARADGDAVLLEVADRGPGIAPARLDAIVEPFVHGGVGAGAGLGLAIARGFAAANEARLELQPRPGGGTLARLVLRAAPVPAEAPA
jgi:two-component system sensor histidine kinase KdpD